MPSGKFASANQKHYPDLGSDTSSVRNFYVRFSDVISGGTSGGVVKCRLFSRAKATAHLVIVLVIRIQMSRTGMGTTILRAKEEISRKLRLVFSV